MEGTSTVKQELQGWRFIAVGGIVRNESYKTWFIGLIENKKQIEHIKADRAYKNR